MRTLLDDMVRKGQIGSFKMAEPQVYRLVPFVVGIYEFHRRERLAKELTELFEEYLPVLRKKSGRSQTSPNPGSSHQHRD